MKKEKVIVSLLTGEIYEKERFIKYCQERDLFDPLNIETWHDYFEIVEL